MKSNGHIFLSYRRSDSRDIAGRIYDSLCKSFGKNKLFFDVDTIPSGVKFAEFIQNNLAKSKVVIVVIGPNWVDARLKNKNDFVRKEIETAIQHDITIIPITVSDASIPEKSSLPSSLGPLVEYNGLKIGNDPDFSKDILKLVHELENYGLRGRKSFTGLRRVTNISVSILVISVMVFSYFIYKKCLPVSGLVLGYGFAFPKVNVARGELEATWETCNDNCLEGVTKSVHLDGKLESGGFAVLNLMKPSYIIGIWTAALPRGSLYFRIAAPEIKDRETLNIEIAVKDSAKDESHYKGSVPTDNQPHDFVISEQDLFATRVDLNDLELISIGVSSSAHTEAGNFKMSIYGVSTQPVGEASPLSKLW